MVAVSSVQRRQKYVIGSLDPAVEVDHTRCIIAKARAGMIERMICRLLVLNHLVIGPMNTACHRPETVKLVIGRLKITHLHVVLDHLVVDPVNTVCPRGPKIKTVILMIQHRKMGRLQRNEVTDHLNNPVRIHLVVDVLIFRQSAHYQCRIEYYLSQSHLLLSFCRYLNLS